MGVDWAQTTEQTVPMAIGTVGRCSLLKQLSCSRQNVLISDGSKHDAPKDASICIHSCGGYPWFVFDVQLQVFGEVYM